MTPPPGQPPRSSRPEWRLVLSGPGEACWNMAVDEVLLLGARERPTVRLYSWEPAAISLGRFQKEPPPGTPPHVPIVRRPTGGGAVFHEREVTFSVACDSRVPPLGGARQDAYQQVHRALCHAFSRIDVEVRSWEGPVSGTGGFCFERMATSDLLHRGKKLVGTAQRRKGGGLLIHGSVPLEPNPLAPSATSLSEAAGRPVGRREVVTLIAEGFEEVLGVRLVRAALTPEEEQAARRQCETGRAVPRRQGWGVPSSIWGKV